MKVKIDLQDQCKKDNYRISASFSENKQFKHVEMKWSSDLLRKGRVEIPIQKGFNLHIENIKKPVLKYNFEIDRAPVEFAFILSGRNRCIMKDDQGTTKSIQTNPGTSVVSYSPKTSGIQETSNERQTTIGIQIDPELLNFYLDDDLAGLPKEFLSAINGSSDSHFYRFDRLNHDIRNVAMQILNCTLTKGAKHLFLKSKALELLALQIAHFYNDPVGSFFSPSLSIRELERVRYARELLIQRLDSPPTLFELSKRVSLTHTKLNQGFRELYGKTVFEYLRSYRLELAKMQLLDSNNTITEIAFACGFSDSSHFSRSFYQVFGIQPGRYRKGHPVN